MVLGLASIAKQVPITISQREIFTMRLVISFLLALSLVACQSEATSTIAEPVAQTATNAPSPSATPTSIPSPTPAPTSLPGELVIPVDSFSSEIPWLPLDEDKRPTVVYLGINSDAAPFTNPDVRRAFAAAIDRDVIAAIANRLYFDNVRPATNLTPPETLGRDLYGEVGIPFDPEMAKTYLQAAGYTYPPTMPPITIFASTRGAAPGFYQQAADALAAMWEEHLGVDVEVRVIGDFGAFVNRLNTDTPQLYLLGWGADINDPTDFLGTLFRADSEFNASHFADVQFDSLLSRAIREGDPAARQLLFIQAEQRLTEDQAGVVPLFHSYFYRGD